MFSSIEQLIVKQLIDEIGCLDASTFEIVGCNVISVLESNRLVHKGINKDYMPVGHTIDSFSDDSLIAVEYSTDKNYFKNSANKESSVTIYAKIENDINHSINHRPPHGPDKIYLLSNQEEPPSFRKSFNKSEAYKNYGDRVIIYDAREVAKLILEQSLNNDTCAGFYKLVFYGFSQNLDNYEYYGRIPAYCDSHIPDPALVDKISYHYDAGNNVCVLYGISGTGKTQVVVDYVHNKKDVYENVLWINGGDWQKDTPLSSIQRTRGGVPVNITGIFKAQKTLLVIDSLERIIELSVFEELEEGFQQGSHIIVTSQLNNVGKPFYIQMPKLSEDVAIRIIGEATSTSSEECKRVVEACGFSPLILSIIRNITESSDISRSDLYQEILAEPENIADAEGFSILDKVISKLEPRCLFGLKKIANSGSNVHDTHFLNNFIGALVKNNLQKLSILLPDNAPGLLKVHDLIAKSVGDNVNSEEISIGIENYIGSVGGEMSPSVLREIHICYEQLFEENVRRGDRTPDWISYSLLQIEDRSREIISEKVCEFALTPDLSLPAVMSIIDSKEANAYKIEGDEHKVYFKECAEQYRVALEQVEDEDIQMEYLHHRGKALRRIGEYQEALECFECVLAKRPDWHATLGQIAHLGARSGVTRTA